MLDIPYRILIAFNPDGSARGAQVQRLRVRAGEPDVELPPEPLAAVLSDPSLSGFASAFAASIVAQRDDALAQRDAARRERDTATASLASVTVERDRLTAELDAIRNPVGVVSARDIIGRIPPNKLAAVQQAMANNPSIFAFILMLVADSGVRLGDPRLAAGAAAFVRAGLFTEAEIDAIIRGT